MSAVAPAGIVVAPVTPMNQDLSVDWGGFDEMVRFLLSHGIHGLTPCAVTAETETLTIDEHRRILARTVELAAGRVPVYCGIGRTSILEMRELLRYASDIQADGLFVITPYASAYTTDEVYAYLADTADRADLPIMIYNCPGYSGVNISVDGVVALSALDNIVAIKEGNQEQLERVVTATRDRGFEVFTARDSYLLESLIAGAAGVISFAANVAPALLVDLYEAWRAGREGEAMSLQADVEQLVGVLTARSYPLFIKAAMSELGLPAGPARRIEGGPDESERRMLLSCLDEIAAKYAATD